MPDYIRKIEQAAQRVYDVAERTPLEPASALSRRLRNRVLLKREDLQPIFSFKLRGAYNKIASLSAAKRRAGVVAASAGNHAQGVALAARRHKVDATIVMPRTTPSIKVRAVRNLGAEVKLVGDTYDEAAAHARSLARTRALIPPYDDAEVIAGGGTVAMEIDEQHPEALDAVFIPCGGGGLLAGMAAWLRHRRPRLRIYAVEPAGAACLHEAMRAGRRVTLPEVGLFVDGAAVARIGLRPWNLLREVGIDGVITVSDDEVCAAVKDIFEDTRSTPEPAGALALAGLKKQALARKWRRKRLVAVHSGANINFDRLRYIAERTELGEDHEAIFSVAIPEKPGSFLKFCKCIGHRAVTEFNYRRSDEALARIFVGVAISHGSRQALLERLRQAGYAVHDMSDNEMAKVHVRYMVGGRAAVANETLYRVEFPERPGALLNFLTQLQAQRWDISMFHYRSHGAAFGRVLVGFDARPSQRRKLDACLRKIGFPFYNESDNLAYRDFLR